MGKSGDDCEESLPTMSQHQLHTENNCDNDKTNSSHKKHHHPVDSCTSTAFGNLESTLDFAKSTYTVCQICCRRLANAKTLARHLQRVHNIEPAPIKSDTLSVATGSEDILADISDSGDGKGDQQAKWGVICSVCGRQFRYRYLLASHSVTHTGERPAACRFPGCGKRFGQTSTRNYHERTHSQARPYICSTCGRCFKQQTILRTHIATIHGSGARPYSCEQCGKSFKLCGALQTHQKTVHSDARPHPCPECPKSFRYLHRLLRHQRALHSDVRPYHCSVCDKTFSQPGNLRTHMRTHTGERPYLCKVCGQSFAHSGTLKGHMSTHQHSSPPALSLATSTTTHLTNNTSLPSFVAN